MKSAAKCILDALMTTRVSLILAGTLLFVALSLFYDEIGFLFAEEPKLVMEVTERFNEGFSQHPEAIEIQGFTPGPKGWYLPPGSAATLRYTLPAAIGPEGTTFLFPVFYRPPQGTNVLKVSWDAAKTFDVIAEDITLLGSRIELALPPQGGRPEFWFEATNNGASPVLILDRLDLRVFEHRPPQPPAPLRMVLAFIGLGLPVVLLVRNRQRSFLLLGILTLGLLPRYLNFLRVVYAPLDPDAQGYRLYAEQMTLGGENGFYSANFSIREPFFLLALKTFFHTFGPSDTHMRLFTLSLSLLLVLLVYKFVKELTGPGAGLVGALITALNLPFVIESGRGLRLELEAVLILLLVMAASFRKPQGKWQWVLAGVWGGLLLLTRWSHLLLVIALILFGASKLEGGWARGIRGPLTALAIVFLLVFPQRYGFYVKYGDPLWDMNMQARGFANLEFVGMPGFPAPDEVRQNVFAGPPLSSREYLFTLHSPAEVGLGTIRGITKVAMAMDQIGYRNQAAALLHVDVGWIDPLWKALGILGLTVASVQLGIYWLPSAFFVSLLPVAFLYDRGLLELDSYRLTMHAFPFFVAASLLLLRSAATTLEKWRWRVRAPLGPKGQERG